MPNDRWVAFQPSLLRMQDELRKEEETGQKIRFEWDDDLPGYVNVCIHVPSACCIVWQSYGCPCDDGTQSIDPPQDSSSAPAHTLQSTCACSGGQFFCVPCSRHFADQGTLDGHIRSKVHKRR